MYPDEFLGLLWTVVNSRTVQPLLLEFAFWAGVLGLSVALMALQPRFLYTVEAAWDRLARRRWLAIALVAAAALVPRAAILPLVPIPEPFVHDEYSLILQAETFASGRVTNPTHPMWQHFEAFHVNMLPTYQAMYPPAQGLFMAMGLLIFGHPWWGVWLSVGIMCAAVTWMLQGWMPPRWALLGGAFCVLRFSLFSYFMNSYFGGAVPALGGALMLGALPRLWKKPAAVNAVVFALGLGILAASRPYEGFLVSLAPLGWMAAWLIRQRAWRPNGEAFRKVAVPAAAMLALCAACLLYYDWRGTGHALEMPYAANQRQYHISKPFVWQTAYPIPAYHHPVMRRFYINHEYPGYLMSRSLWGLEELSKKKLDAYYQYWIWPLMVLFVPSLWIMLKSRRVRVLGFAALFVLAGMLVISWPPQGHYLSPVLGVVVAIALYGLRLLRTWRPLRIPAGLMISRSIVLLLLAWSFLPVGYVLVNPFNLKPWVGLAPPLDRARLQHQLEQLPGQQLVIVHTRTNYAGSCDWIYNQPDIDHAKVVWARDMGTERNQELVDYFPHHKVWTVDQNDSIMRLEAYTGRTTEEILAATHTPAPGHVN